MPLSYPDDPRINNLTTPAQQAGAFFVCCDASKYPAKIQYENLDLGGGGVPYVCLKDLRTSGTDGGTFSPGAWRTRVLNTEETDTDNICTLASNQFTLPAGTYRIYASAEACSVKSHQLRLYDTTHTTTLIPGTSTYANNVSFEGTRAFVMGRFTLTETSTLELQHRCEIERITVGLGIAASFGENELYAVVELWKEE